MSLVKPHVTVLTSAQQTEIAALKAVRDKHQEAFSAAHKAFHSAMLVLAGAKGITSVVLSDDGKSLIS